MDKENPRSVGDCYCRATTPDCSCLEIVSIKNIINRDSIAHGRFEGIRECFADSLCRPLLKITAIPAIQSFNIETTSDDIIRIVESCGVMRVTNGAHRIELARENGIDNVIALVYHESCED